MRNKKTMAVVKERSTLLLTTTNNLYPDCQHGEIFLSKNI